MRKHCDGEKIVLTSLTDLHILAFSTSEYEKADLEDIMFVYMYEVFASP
jgi:hypothetical protein